jgi:uncharacterized membrane protein
MKQYERLFAFLMGYFIYSLIEIINRGYTHWTMSLTGGVVLMLLYTVNSHSRMTLMKSCFTGALLITSVELTVGIFDNLIMHWNVWDYSGMPMNFLGQICPLFSCYWFLLCIPAYFLCRMIRRRLSPQ